MALDSNDLILFARVMENGSFSRAAEQTGLPKSTLSRRITQLEETLGERLLTRSTRQLSITEFGAQMLEHANRLLEESEAALALAQNRQAVPRGVLRIAAPTDLIALDLSDLLTRFAEKYPQVKLHFDLSSRRVDLAADGFDLALRVALRLPDDDLLVARRMGDLPAHLYASPAYLKRRGTPDQPDDLRQHNVLGQIDSGGHLVPWQLTQAGSKWSWSPETALTANAPSFLRDLASHGMGIVALPDRMAKEGVGKGFLSAVLPDWQLPTPTIWCVTPGRRLLPSRTVVFIDMLRDALQARIS